MKRALAAALVASALLLGVAVLGRVVGRPLVPGWLMVAVFLCVAAAQVTLVIRMREAAADSAADGTAFWSWTRAPSAIVTAGVLLASVAFMLAIAAFIGLKEGGPMRGGPDCEFYLNNKGATKCVDEATYLHAGAVEQSLGLSIAAAFIAGQALAFACTRDTGRASPIWVEGTREADWD